MKGIIKELFYEIIIQYRWGREYFGGKFYFMAPRNIKGDAVGHGYWYSYPIYNIAIILKEEEY